MFIAPVQKILPDKIVWWPSAEVQIRRDRGRTIINRQRGPPHQGS